MMMQSHNSFVLEATDGRARVGRLSLPRGEVRTPAFMPVGTQASVKSLDPDDIRSTGSQIILANTYHLMLRPGPDALQKLGGVSRFMRWGGPVLTDSGGFQVFSLAGSRKLTDEGVVFRSHLDGSQHLLTPEIAMELQFKFGSDITMALDVLAGFDDSESAQVDAMRRTHAWLPRNSKRFRELHESDSPRGLLFGIAQGGFDANRRQESAAFVAASDIDGCAIGGLSVGEPKETMAEMLDASISGLPDDRPRYLMGVGSPEDLWNGVAAGVDMFDCVLPTRVARRGALFTREGRIDITAARYKVLDEPIEADCDCYACQTFSAAYIHHLFRARELLAYRLASIHNVRFLVRQMEQMEDAIRRGAFAAERRAFIDTYQPANQRIAAEQRAKHRAARARDFAR